MSKNFENEYIALTEIEVPDLWDRIEAGLTPKTAPDFKENKASIIEFGRENVPADKEENKKKTSWYFFKKYQTVLAAAVCVIVILPAAILLGKMGIGMGGAKECAADTAAAETMDYAVTTEAEEAPAEFEEAFAQEAWEESVAEEEVWGAREESAAEEAWEESVAEEVTWEADTESALAEKSEEIPEEAELEELAEASVKAQDRIEGVRVESEKEKNEAAVTRLDAEDGTVLTHVTVLVYGQEEFGETEENTDLGNLYRAKVLEDRDGLLQKGEEIYIYISPLSSIYWPDEEAVYEVMLEYDSQREYPFYLR